MSTKDDLNELQNWIVTWLCRELTLKKGELSFTENLLTYGIDSVAAIMLVGDLEDRLKVRLPPTLLWDHPTVQSLMDRLAEILREQPQSAAATTPSRSIDSMGIEEARNLLEKLDELSDAEVDALLARLSQD